VARRERVAGRCVNWSAAVRGAATGFSLLLGDGSWSLTNPNEQEIILSACMFGVVRDREFHTAGSDTSRGWLARDEAAAVRAARQYIRGELYGEGKTTIYSDGQPVRQDERSIHTGMRWETRLDF